MYGRNDIRDKERRRKRFVIPIVYFIVENIFFWLVLSLIQLEFNLAEWKIWAVVIFMIAFLYSLAKTIHVFERQKDYPENDSE